MPKTQKKANRRKPPKIKPLALERVIVKYLLIVIVLYILFLVLTRGNVTLSDLGLLIWG